MSDQLITLIWTVVKIIAIILPITIAVAYYTYFERKIIGYMHARQGPNRIGPWGLIQPFADVFKMLFKELIIPLNASTFLYRSEERRVGKECSVRVERYVANYNANSISVYI